MHQAKNARLSLLGEPVEIKPNSLVFNEGRGEVQHPLDKLLSGGYRTPGTFPFEPHGGFFPYELDVKVKPVSFKFETNFTYEHIDKELLAASSFDMEAEIRKDMARAVQRQHLRDMADPSWLKGSGEDQTERALKPASYKGVEFLLGPMRELRPVDPVKAPDPKPETLTVEKLTDLIADVYKVPSYLIQSNPRGPDHWAESAFHQQSFSVPITHDMLYEDHYHGASITVPWGSTINRVTLNPPPTKERYPMNFSHFDLKADSDHLGKVQLVDLPNDSRVRFVTAEESDDNVVIAVVRVTYSNPTLLPSSHSTPRAFVVADVNDGLSGAEDTSSFGGGGRNGTEAHTDEDRKAVANATRVSEIGNIPEAGLIVFERH